MYVISPVRKQHPHHRLVRFIRSTVSLLPVLLRFKLFLTSLISCLIHVVSICFYIYKYIKGYGIAVGVAILIVFILGICTFVLVNGDAVNYFVAGKTLPMWVVSMTLGAVAVDSNTLLGNVDLSYQYAFWDGAVLPIGLCCSLILNSFTLGPKFNDEKNALTLPDVIGNRYGVIVEVLCSMCCITSSLMLLAGNLVGMGVVTAYIWGTSQTFGIWIAGILNWSFTVAGGLFSIAYVDVGLGAIGWYEKKSKFLINANAILVVESSHVPFFFP